MYRVIWLNGLYLTLDELISCICSHSILQNPNKRLPSVNCLDGTEKKHRFLTFSDQCSTMQYQYLGHVSLNTKPTCALILISEGYCQVFANVL
jgi:hypothetical protein